MRDHGATIARACANGRVRAARRGVRIRASRGMRALLSRRALAVNDSLRTTICLQYAPRCLAAAAAMMASNYLEAK